MRGLWKRLKQSLTSGRSTPAFVPALVVGMDGESEDVYLELKGTPIIAVGPDYPSAAANMLAAIRLYCTEWQVFREAGGQSLEAADFVATMEKLSDEQLLDALTLT